MVYLINICSCYEDQNQKALKLCDVVVISLCLISIMFFLNTFFFQPCNNLCFCLLKMDYCEQNKGKPQSNTL